MSPSPHSFTSLCASTLAAGLAAVGLVATGLTTISQTQSPHNFASGRDGAMHPTGQFAQQETQTSSQTSTTQDARPPDSIATTPGTNTSDLAPATSAAYDPLKISHSSDVVTLDLEFTDDARQRRIPLRIYLPLDVSAPAATPQPVILFSHGLGGSRQGSTFLGQHWAKRGYIAVFLQHTGSDEDVWRDIRLNQRRAALVQAANGQQLNERKQDVATALEQLERWQKQPEHPLAERMDLTRVGMSGHSFGARTTQQVSGETPWGRVQTTDQRIRAAIVMSPSVPAAGNPDRAFRNVQLPWLLMTGTHDDSPLGDQTPASRRRVYPALPPGDKYELVLDGAEHSVFTDRRLSGEAKPRRPEHHRSILALSTAFWDTYLRDDPAAKAWLQGTEPQSVLDPTDLWHAK